ncbi:MAG: hypothetical protein H6709_25075, partial [Kofleriaceae bacterium]|nr:hypothetical protein [Kofleriaceae bacterium]
DRAGSALARALGLSGGDLVAGPGGEVLIAGRGQGTRVPTVVGLDADRGERWRVEIPLDPLAAAEREPEMVLVGADDVCLAYYATSVAAPLHVACFALADGARRWDLEIGDSPFEGLSATADLVLVSRWGVLEAHDRATGTIRWTFGRYGSAP